MMDKAQEEYDEAKAFIEKIEGNESKVMQHEIG
jgi:hypothetical protein